MSIKNKTLIDAIRRNDRYFEDYYGRKIELFRRFQLGEDLGMVKLAAKSYRPVNKNMAAYILDDDRDISNRRKGR